MQQQDRGFDAAVGAAERITCRLTAAVRQAHEHVLASSQQLFIGRLQVPHEPAIDTSEQDHQQRGEEIERDLLSGTGDEPRRTGDRLRAGIEPHGMVRFLQKRNCAIVGNSDCERAETLRLAQARKRERRRAAGGYCDEDILAVDLVLSNDEVCATLVEVAKPMNCRSVSSRT